MECQKDEPLDLFPQQDEVLAATARMQRQWPYRRRRVQGRLPLLARTSPGLDEELRHVAKAHLWAHFKG
jgi:hypothetical protein